MPKAPGNHKYSTLEAKIGKKSCFGAGIEFKRRSQRHYIFAYRERINLLSVKLKTIFSIMISLLTPWPASQTFPSVSEAIQERS